MRYINTLQEGQHISEIYLCKTKVDARTKNGKPYYNLTLQDKTGTVNAKIWELTNGIDDFDAMDYVHIDADVTSFQNALQVNIHRLRRAGQGEFFPGDYLPVSPYDIPGMFRELTGFVRKIEDPHLRRLAESFFDDEAFAGRFRQHSAARSVHHSFVGGLLQHTLRVTQLCAFYADQYPLLKRDLLITGGLLHDIGKLDELSPFPENDYTDEGQLVGHLVIGARMVHEHIAAIPDFPKKTANLLEHMILSHHGELEFGSPKVPATIEALALHFADNTDAKLQIFGEILSNPSSTGDWLGYQKLLDTNVRRS